MRTMAAGAFLLLLVQAGCGGDAAGEADAAVADAGVADAGPPPDAAPPDADPTDPPTLRHTGLYADGEGEELAEGVVFFQPAHELWADGASKRRWVYLPPGEFIDTSDMDFWTYPVGTKLWKEFAVDRVRLETRLLYKHGPGRLDWFMVSFVWNEEQTEAVAMPGGLSDVQGTGHRVPSRNECRLCHEPMPDIALGLSAVLLDHDLPGLRLHDLVVDGRLSHPPAGDAPGGYLPIPGDATARGALGYLHANCGGCHHDQSEVMDNVDVDLRLMAGELDAVTDTRAYTTAVGVPPMLGVDGAISLIEPGDPGASAVHLRMGSRQDIAMPPLGTVVVDDAGLASVAAWITALGE
jgi:hypothetical protein